MNSKRKLILLIIELCLSFLTLLAIIVIISGLLKNKNQTVGYQYQNVYQITFNNLGQWSSDDIKQMLQIIQNQDNVTKIGYWHYNPPFSKQETVPGGEVKCKGIKLTEKIYLFRADQNMADIFNIKPLHGRWFNESDLISKDWPVLINRKLQEKYYKTGNPIGQTIEICGVLGKIVGIIDDFKYQGEYSNSENLVIAHETFREKVNYTGSSCLSCKGCGWDIFFVKTNTYNAYFEDKTSSLLSTKFPDWNINIEKVTDLHKKYTEKTWGPILLSGLIILFVLSNVLLGIFGLMWYNVSKRKPEIGLRIAVGANRYAIFKQFSMEIMALGTFGILPGIVIAMQMPFLGLFEIDIKLYLFAILIATIITYFLLILCSILPSAMASSTMPAKALYE